VKLFSTAILLMVGLLLQQAPAVSSAEPAASMPPLAQAHAHNDYAHPRPLLDALDHGFCNVEADIFLVDGQLLVGHTRKEVKPERTLRGLYLDPLLARVKENRGSVYPHADGTAGTPFTLLIDIKTDAEPAYALLDKTLAEYAEMLTEVQDGKVTPRAVTVVVSGARPIETIQAQSHRFVGIDGRMEDLDSTLAADLMPLVSDNWALQFRWRGKGEMPAAEQAKLTDAVTRAHAHGRKVRFWGTPENEAIWRTLRDSGVDLINTDNLAGLEKFLRAGAAPQKAN